MTVGDGMMEKASNDPVQSGSLLSLLPSVALHGVVALIIWLGILTEEQIQPPVTFISLAPAAAPAPDQPAPPAPVVAAPEPEVEPEPLPLPETGMVLPQPEPPAETPEPVVDFTPPELPEVESFPFDPNATREPEPEPEEAVAIEQKKVAEKPKEPEKPKPKPEKPKEKAKTKPKKETKKAAVPQSKPVQTPKPAAAAPSQPNKAAPAKPSAPKSTQEAAVSDAPVRVTNANYAGACPIEYPRRAERRNQQGTVMVRVLVGTDGKPIEVSLARSSGHELLDEAALAALPNCAFVPQKVGSRAVKAIVDVPVAFGIPK
jgi:periplasmic protein TonB